MIDICDFAVGQSRMLYGLTIQSERPSHRLMEQWHPLGVVAVITAFNFPVAVWSWNAALAAVCGDATVWKPSEKTPLTAIAVTKIAERVCRETGADPAIFTLLIGDRQTVGAKTGGRSRGFRWSRRPVRRPWDRRSPKQCTAGSAGRILELGGNNALIVCAERRSRDGDAIDFFRRGRHGGAALHFHAARHRARVGRATSCARNLLAAYKSLPIGNPLDRKTLMGPMIDQAAVDAVLQSIAAIERGRRRSSLRRRTTRRRKIPGGCYMTPCLANAKPDFEIVQHETFGPLLYLLTYRDFDEAIAIHNDVPQGLTSAIFTNDVREAERFLSAAGSDCGIANVNTGTSGAEIGGAFGGEKETGGGRESGSDSLEELHAPADEHDQLLDRTATGAGNSNSAVPTKAARRRNNVPLFWAPNAFRVEGSCGRP